MSVRSLQAWIGPFAPALPKSNQIVSEMHLATSQIAPLRVADDLGTTSVRLSHILVDQQGWQATSPQTSGLDPSAQDSKRLRSRSNYITMSHKQHRQRHHITHTHIDPDSPAGRGNQSLSRICLINGFPCRLHRSFISSNSSRKQCDSNTNRSQATM